MTGRVKLDAFVSREREYITNGKVVSIVGFSERYACCLYEEKLYNIRFDYLENVKGELFVRIS